MSLVITGASGVTPASPPRTETYEQDSIYDSAHDILGEIEGVWARLMSETERRLDTPAKESKRLFHSYQLGGSRDYLSLVLLGGEKMRGDAELIENMGTLATESQVREKPMRKILADRLNLSPGSAKKATKKHLSEGAILNDARWWVTKNDLFMLGAIHVGKEFHLTNKRPHRSLMWDNENNRFRVLGRELFLLQIHGYQRIQSKKRMGVVFAPPNGPYEKFTLSRCRKRIDEVKSLDALKPILGNLYNNSCNRTPIKKEGAKASSIDIPAQSSSTRPENTSPKPNVGKPGAGDASKAGSSITNPSDVNPEEKMAADDFFGAIR